MCVCVCVRERVRALACVCVRARVLFCALCTHSRPTAVSQNPHHLSKGNTSARVSNQQSPGRRMLAGYIIWCVLPGAEGEEVAHMRD